MNDTQEWTDKEVIECFTNPNFRFGIVVMEEVTQTLEEVEKPLILKQLENLALQNRDLTGSNPVGYFLDGEFFYHSPAYGQENVKEIHESLREDATYLKQNRDDVIVCSSYFANMLSYLSSSAASVEEFVANLPEGLSKCSTLLSKLESIVLRKYQNDLSAYKYHREDKSKAPYFFHLDRCEGPLARFLFRRVIS